MIKGPLRVALLALWHLFIHGRRERLGIVKAADAATTAAKLLKNHFPAEEQPGRLPQRSAVSALFAEGKLAISSFSAGERRLFERVLDYYGRYAPHVNYRWEIDGRQFDAQFCAEHNFLILSDKGDENVFPWAQVILDVHSRYCVLAKIQPGALTAQGSEILYREAILPKPGTGNIAQGEPDFFICDQGPENKGRVPDLVEATGGTYRQLPKATPKLKAHVERIHRTFAQYLRIHENDFFTHILPDRSTVRAIRFSRFAARFYEVVAEYQRKLHSSIKETPRNKYLRGGNLRRERQFDADTAVRNLCHRVLARVYDDHVVFAGVAYHSPYLAEHEWVWLHVLIGDEEGRIEIFDADDEEFLDVVSPSDSDEYEEEPA